MPAHDETIKDIDAKIEQNQQLLNEAQKWINLFGTLQNNVAVLKRAKALLERDEILPEPSGHAYVMPESEVQPPQPHGPDTVPAHGSIGSLIITVLTEAATPLPLQTILERVHAKGRPEVTLRTLGGVISQYLLGKKIQRTARATYALPPATLNAAMHTE